jgi:hypothetical protein
MVAMVEFMKIFTGYASVVLLFDYVVIMGCPGALHNEKIEK